MLRSAKHVLFVDEPYEKFGITVPSFYVGTKWHPAGEELTKASEAFPDLTFHISWDVEGSVGEAVIKNGMVKEKFKWEALAWIIRESTSQKRKDALKGR
jgi:hypothetical protein